ncbi:lamin tail domain-containing protein [Candidatus Palauibacter sp.]|uniref:lamin tail domain-containing protein n=1 Tax=Candidatus Palauibacter sp. TaxID=3101350 RepID=UPI003B02616C
MFQWSVKRFLRQGIGHYRTARLMAAVSLAALPSVAASAAPARAHEGGTCADACVTAAAPSLRPFPADSVLRITFLDVGQGDAVLVQVPSGQVALIDAGRSDVVRILRQFGVSAIDLLVATHPHADHIGGMAGVIETFPVRFYMDNGQPHTTATYRRLLSALDARPDITYLEASPRTLTLGDVEIEVLPLLPPGSTQHNDRSVSLVVRYGNFTAFLSGDSEVRQLTHLVSQGAVHETTVLKAPHHGSDNGFTWDFLDMARPRVVVISVGRNSYGHPRPAAVQAYDASGATVFRTDLHGHVSVSGRQSGDYEVAAGGNVALRDSARGDEPRPVGTPVPVPDPGGEGNAGIRIRVHADAPGNDHRNPNGEYAVIENLESEDRAVGGWTLCDRANHCFHFPPDAVVAAGGRLVVHTGSGQADGTRYYMGRRQAVWNNTGDTATLYDSEGAAVVVFNY